MPLPAALQTTQAPLLLPFCLIAVSAMTIYRNPRTNASVKVNKTLTVLWSYLFGPLFYLRIGAVGHAVAYTVLCLLLWAHNLYLVVWAVYAVFAPSIVRRQWLSRGYVEQ